MSKKRVEYSETFKAEVLAKIKENKGNISLTARHTHEHISELVKEG